MSSELDVAELQHTNRKTRVALVETALAMRSRYVKEALTVLAEHDETAAEQNELHAAIEVLGVLRAPEGVGRLLRLLSFKATTVYRTEARPFNLGDFYPAVKALVKIGKPAVSPSIWELTKAGTPDRREKLCWIIGAIEGPKVARMLIEDQIAELEEQAQQAKAKGAYPKEQYGQIERLRATIPVLEKLFPAVKKKQKSR